MTLAQGALLGDYTYNYNSKGEPASKVVYFYGTTDVNATRAEAADSEDTTLQINTYRGARDITTVVNIGDTEAGSLIRSITRNNVKDALRSKGARCQLRRYYASNKHLPGSKGYNDSDKHRRHRSRQPH
jgi:hypothetical protein